MRLKQSKSPLKSYNQKKSPTRSTGFLRSELPSPIKAFKNLDMMQTAKSNVFAPSADGNLDDGRRFSSVLAKYQNN